MCAHVYIYTRASLIALLVKSLPAMQETPVQVWVKKICWRRDRLPTPVFLGFPCDSAGKESACNVGNLGSIPGLGRSPGEEKGRRRGQQRMRWLDGITDVMDMSLIPGLGRSPGEEQDYPLWYSGLENSTDCIVHRVTKSRT